MWIVVDQLRKKFKESRSDVGIKSHCIKEINLFILSMWDNCHWGMVDCQDTQVHEVSTWFLFYFMLCWCWFSTDLMFILLFLLLFAKVFVHRKMNCKLVMGHTDPWRQYIVLTTGTSCIFFRWRKGGIPAVGLAWHCMHLRARPVWEQYALYQGAWGYLILMQIFDFSRQFFFQNAHWFYIIFSRPVGATNQFWSSFERSESRYCCLYINI